VEIRQDVARFTAGDIVNFMTCRAVAAKCAYLQILPPVSDLSAGAVDWSIWRLALEYQQLYFRTYSAERMRASPTEISGHLMLAYGLSFISQPKAAQRVLSDVPIIDVIKVTNRVLKPNETRPVLGAIGFFYDSMIGRQPDHPAYAYDRSELLTRKGLDIASDWRAAYGNPLYEGGALLPGPVGDLVPLELIYLNAHLPAEERDADLAEMAARMAETTYPEDETFVDIDVQLAVAGY
jgi:hypothetical protein